MAKYTFKVARVSRVRDGVEGYSYCAKMNGKMIVLGWAPGTQADARQEAEVQAEAYGYIDGVS